MRGKVACRLETREIQIWQRCDFISGRKIHRNPLHKSHYQNQNQDFSGRGALWHRGDATHPALHPLKEALVLGWGWGRSSLVWSQLPHSSFHPPLQSPDAAKRPLPPPRRGWWKPLHFLSQQLGLHAAATSPPPPSPNIDVAKCPPPSPLPPPLHRFQACRRKQPLPSNGELLGVE